MERLYVDLGKNSYDIVFADSYINKLEEYISSGGPNIIVTDSNFFGIYRDVLESKLAKLNLHTYIIPAGEDSKSISTIVGIINYMLDNRFSRSSRVIALGGGVVGDVAGFAASIYMRGLAFYQVPTTLLSQVDSSVGGKTGINFPQGKNVVGSFYQPKEVLIAPEFLRTLGKRELTSGIGEIIKYGLIYDHTFFLEIKEALHDIYAINIAALKAVIRRCCEIKANLVEKDERDEGLRKILNLGHTFGHAIETITKYQSIAHGEAVLLGILYESQLAEGLGLIDKEYHAEIAETISRTNISTGILPLSISSLVDVMSIDKKNSAGKISFILPVDRGRAREVLLTKEEVLSILVRQGVI
jgi:3-dehydroquinate synthase